MNEGFVKFLSNGLFIRSSIERGVKERDFLNLHGELIQVICLHTYLFFGNAKKVSRSKEGAAESDTPPSKSTHSSHFSLDTVECLH